MHGKICWAAAMKDGLNPTYRSNAINLHEGAMRRVWHVIFRKMLRAAATDVQTTAQSGSDDRGIVLHNRAPAKPIE